MAKETIKKQKTKRKEEFNPFYPEDVKARKEVIAKGETSENPVLFTKKEKIGIDKLLASMKNSEMDSIFKDGYTFKQGTTYIGGRHIICATIVKGKAEKEETDEEDDGQPKAPTAKEILRIQKEIRDQVKAMLLLPPPEYVTITPALNLGKLGSPALCTYAIDKIIRTQAIVPFAGCTPTTAAVELVYTNLLTLAGVKTITLSDADKLNKKNWTKQLKKMLYAMAVSCASLADGNLPLYLLTGMGVKGAGVSHDAQLNACVFKITTNHGGNILGVECTPIAYAKNYTIYYSSLLPFSMATASQQTGPFRQLLELLTGGEMMTIIMVANGKKLKGKIADPQTRRVPYN
jgi:hypothetical protein